LLEVGDPKPISVEILGRFPVIDWPLSMTPYKEFTPNFTDRAGVRLFVVDNDFGNITCQGTLSHLLVKNGDAYVHHFEFCLPVHQQFERELVAGWRRFRSTPHAHFARTSQPRGVIGRLLADVQ